MAEMNKSAQASFQVKDAPRIRYARKLTGASQSDTMSTIRYYNRTDRPIVITERDGTKQVIQPCQGPIADEIIVSVTRSMTRAIMEKTLDFLLEQPRTDDAEFGQWVIAYEGALRNERGKYLDATVEYLYSFRDLEDAGGRCYMPSVDILVEWLTCSGAEHPFSRRQRDRAVLDAILPDVSEKTHVMMIKLVDNGHGGHYSDRYVNLGGDVYRLPIEKDPSYSTGVHVVTRSPVTDDGRSSAIITRRYTYDEADKRFCLHRSIQDAREGGPVEAMAKQIVEHETALKKIHEARLKNESLDMEAVIQRLRNEGALDKVKMDNATYARKNWVEWGKTITSLLGVVITIYGIWGKLKTS